MDYRLYLSLFLTTAVACTGADSEILTHTEGEVAYDDAETNAADEPQQPARPAPQPAGDPMMVEVILEGRAEMNGLEPECELDAVSGSFDGWLAGEAAVDDDGFYVAALTAEEAVFETPGGCAVPELDILAVTHARVRATLSATERNCEGYCAARARAHAEDSCQVAADRAACWAAATADYQASCQATCRSERVRVIVAEAELDATALAALDAEALEGALLGEIRADLTFDHMEDTEGEAVDESP